MFDIGRTRCHIVIVPSCGADKAGHRRMMGIEETLTGEPIMSLASHLEELQRKHGDLDREIDEALAHPSTDALEIARMKRRKLALKDQIEKLKTQSHTTH